MKNSKNYTGNYTTSEKFVIYTESVVCSEFFLAGA